MKQKSAGMMGCRQMSIIICRYFPGRACVGVFDRCNLGMIIMDNYAPVGGVSSGGGWAFVRQEGGLIVTKQKGWRNLIKNNNQILV